MLNIHNLYKSLLLIHPSSNPRKTRRRSLLDNQPHHHVSLMLHVCNFKIDHQDMKYSYVVSIVIIDTHVWFQTFKDSTNTSAFYVVLHFRKKTASSSRFGYTLATNRHILRSNVFIKVEKNRQTDMENSQILPSRTKRVIFIILRLFCSKLCSVLKLNCGIPMGYKLVYDKHLRNDNLALSLFRTVGV